jgi:NAD(P)H-dependent flavin oxidoreductase YrpB (nitropropane dioxygenase family)
MKDGGRLLNILRVHFPRLVSRMAGSKMSLPIIVQGGMGVGVSDWRLARTVSQLGQLGVVSGALLAIVFARRLQAGDPGGAMRHAMDHFPIPSVAERVIEEYFVPGGKEPSAAFQLSALPTLHPCAALVELMVAANFAEVFLAKEGHAGLVGINLLEKVQLATLPSLLGAMLANVDYVLMGAGIPRAIPGVLDQFANGDAAELRIDADGTLPGEEFVATLDPRAFCGEFLPKLKRPKFLAIVASATLAITLARKSSGLVNGFVIEGDVAGGHNAPPRGPLQLTAAGEPIYGSRDLPDLEKFRALGLPFWLAGAYARPEKLAEATREGAAGIQVGTPFAFCDESGIDPNLKRRVCKLARAGQTSVFTDPLASPTGFPFKVLQMSETLSEADNYAARERFCDLGYLRQSYRKPDGTLGHRCAAEPVGDYVRKGGEAADTDGRKCLCNGLMTNTGFGQVRPNGTNELPLLTAGNDVADLGRFLKPGADSYTAADVVAYLLNPSAPA